MRGLEYLYPPFKEKIEQLVGMCKERGLNIGLGETLRTVEEQNEKYAQGRTKPGKIITNAKGTDYNSQHQWGIAFDFFKNVKGSEFNDMLFFEQVGALAKSIGLGWGGDWTSPKDRPHIFWNQWGNTPAQLKNQYGTPENFMSTWVKEKPIIPNNAPVKPEVLHNGNVLEWQKAMNIGFDYKNRSGQVLKDGYLAEDGYFGPASQRFASDHQLHYDIKNCVTAVKWLQKRLSDLGYKTPVDGNIGPGCDAMIKAFQHDRGLTNNGWVGLNTTKELLK